MPTSNEGKNTARLATNRHELGKLYPTPKTYDQLANDREIIARLHAKRMPKYIFLTTSLKMYSVVVGLLLAINALPFLMSTSVISGVFLSFLLGLIVYAYMLWVTSNITRTFERMTLNATPLFLFYLFFFPTPAYLLYTLIDHLPVIAWVTVLTCLHFIIVYALLKMIEKYTRRD